MDDNSGVPDPFYRPAYKLLAQVSSHPLAEVIDIHLEMETDSNSSSFPPTSSSSFAMLYRREIQRFT